jgi:predicted Zn-dependent peptidase
MMMFGIKLDKTKSASAYENDIAEIKLAFEFDNVFGKTSPVYRDLMDRQLINDTFEFSITNEDDYGFILIYTESKKPQATKKALLDLLKNIDRHLTDENRFLISKRKMLGNFIQTFDHISALSSFLTEYFLSGVDLFQLFQDVDNISFQTIQHESAGIEPASVSFVHYHP